MKNLNLNQKSEEIYQQLHSMPYIHIMDVKDSGEFVFDIVNEKVENKSFKISSNIAYLDTIYAYVGDLGDEEEIFRNFIVCDSYSHEEWFNHHDFLIYGEGMERLLNDEETGIMKKIKEYNDNGKDVNIRIYHRPISIRYNEEEKKFELYYAWKNEWEKSIIWPSEKNTSMYVNFREGYVSREKDDECQHHLYTDLPSFSDENKDELHGTSHHAYVVTLDNDSIYNEKEDGEDYDKVKVIEFDDHDMFSSNNGLSINNRVSDCIKTTINSWIEELKKENEDEYYVGEITVSQVEVRLVTGIKDGVYEGDEFYLYKDNKSIFRIYIEDGEVEIRQKFIDRDYKEVDMNTATFI